ncbi:prolyl oligopeptidase family serine peptidase [Pasteurellaceae bacterium LIM206]|nr:prolyl oligopeptidase family serine peptidase [Pasteurellaceae bacterium LIM206]
MRKTVISLALAGALSMPAYAAIETVTAVSTPHGSGQAVTEMILQYDEAVAAKSLNKTAFSVSDRNIIGVSLDKKDPRKVVLTLDPQDTDASVMYKPRKSDKSQQKAGNGTPTFSVETQSVMREFNNVIEQKSTLTAANGRKIAPNSAKISKLVNLVADDFSQHEYTDAATGTVIKYNLFVPKNYDPKKSYPLVMFIHDAGATNTYVKTTLYQGNGATSFAAPKAQAKQQAFVLAPQFDHVITNDNSDDPADLEPLVNLIQSLTKEYAIDSNRLYTTGQSGGAMMSLALNIKHPDLFAASWIVAGQWAPEKTAPIAKNNLFVLVSENDAKAFPTEKSIMEVLKANGAKVEESFGWDGQAPVATLDKNTEALLAKGGNVHFAAFKGDSLPLEQQTGNKGAAHMGTWKVAYHIDAIRDWLYSQKK